MDYRVFFPPPLRLLGDILFINRIVICFRVGTLNFEAKRYSIVYVFGRTEDDSVGHKRASNAKDIRSSRRERDPSEPPGSATNVIFMTSLSVASTFGTDCRGGENKQLVLPCSMSRQFISSA